MRPGSARSRRRSGKQRRTNNVKTFSALSRGGASLNQALPTAYARSARVRWKRTKRRAFFLLETGKALTKTTKRLRALLIAVIVLGVSGVMLETTVVELSSPAQKEALRVFGFVTELVSTLVMIADAVVRTWASTVDARLSRRVTVIPCFWKTRDRTGCTCSGAPPPGALEVDREGHPRDPDVEHADERPRPLSCRAVGRLQYNLRPWNILELITLVPVGMWLFSGGGLPVFELSQWAHGLRFLRLLRVIALRRMFPGVRLLFKVLATKGRELSSAFVMAFIVAVLLGAVVYELERPRAERTPFRTMFDGAYWSTISLSTVGFGDLTPKRLPGRLVTAFAVAVLIGVFTLPAGVISSGFVELTDRARVSRREAVARMERAYRRLVGRTLLRRWHVNADAAKGSQLARTRSERVMSFTSSRRRLTAHAGGMGAASAFAGGPSTPVPGTPGGAAAMDAPGTPLAAAAAAGGAAPSPSAGSPLRSLPSGRITLSRTDDLRSVCMLDPELAATAGSMNRAHLRRIVAALAVLRRCGGSDAVLFETLGKHLNAAQLLT